MERPHFITIMENAEKDIERLKKQIAQCEEKLSNENFLGKAPESIIIKEIQKQEDFEKQLFQLKHKDILPECIDRNKFLGSFMVKNTTFYISRV
jgi:hypothetical protein